MGSTYYHLCLLLQMNMLESAVIMEMANRSASPESPRVPGENAVPPEVNGTNDAMELAAEMTSPAELSRAPGENAVLPE